MNKFKDRENRRKEFVVSSIGKHVPDPGSCKRGHPKLNRERKKQVCLTALPSLYGDIQKIAYTQNKSVNMHKNNWINLGKILDEKFQKNTKWPEKLETGFPSLDEALGGGISPGLIILGGMPGLGKSTLALQLAEFVIEKGTHVLYFSMEMPGDRILAKSISRHLYDKRKIKVSAETLMGGKNREQIKTEEWDAIWNVIEENVRKEIKESVVRYLHVCTETISASEVLENVKSFMDSEEMSQNKKPLVIVDYLQILKSETVKTQSDKQNIDSSLKYLIELAHSTGGGLPVILISSLNRGSYNGAIQINAFKETGGIEYSADVLLGLQFQACHTPRANLAAEQKKEIRKVEISILKNRYGRSGDTVPLEYIPAYDYFSEPKDEASEKTRKRKKGFTYTINNTKIANEIRKGKLRTDSCLVGKVKCTLTESSLDTSSLPLSYFDCCVADTLYSLQYVESDSFLKDVWQVLTGAPGQNLTRKQKDEINESIEKLKRARISIDCKSELMEREIETDWEYDIPSPFLTVVNEKAVMPLYIYGEKMREMITFPSILLDVFEVKKDKSLGRRMSNTKEIICLKWFLIHRLEIIRYMDKKSKQEIKFRTISFAHDGQLLSELGTLWEKQEETNPMKKLRKQKLKKLHEATENILKYYKHIEYITDYKKTAPKPKPGKNKDSTLKSFEIIGPIKDIQSVL